MAESIGATWAPSVAALTTATVAATVQLRRLPADSGTPSSRSSRWASRRERTAALHMPQSNTRDWGRCAIGPGGLEPPFPDPKSGVLPLDEGPAIKSRLNLLRRNRWREAQLATDPDLDEGRKHSATLMTSAARQLQAPRFPLRAAGGANRA